ncbi:MAG: hypothetical protein ACKVP0_21405 [Pirellulaceae bacterium]
MIFSRLSPAFAGPFWGNNRRLKRTSGSLLLAGQTHRGQEAAAAAARVTCGWLNPRDRSAGDRWLAFEDRFRERTRN